MSGYENIKTTLRCLDCVLQDRYEELYEQYSAQSLISKAR